MEEQEERCIPWDPIPRAYNHASDVGITNFGEVGDTSGVACQIFSGLPDGTADRDHSWRIYFNGTLAYRLRPIGQWPEALPFIWAPKSWPASGTRRVALWEVTASVYLAQNVDYSLRKGAHHYVLVDHDMAYEVIALGYHVEDLGPVSE